MVNVKPITLTLSARAVEFVNQLEPNFLKRTKEIQAILNERPAVELNFTSFVSNSTLVISRAFVDYLNEHGVYCRALHLGDSFDYANRIGFFSDFTGAEYSYKKHPAKGRFMDLTYISSHDTKVAQKVSESLKEYSEIDGVYISDEALDILIYSVGELISNVRRHARFTGRVSFQYYKGDGFVEITVCDCGIGITESLAKAGYTGTDVELLKLSIMKNVTSSRSIGPYGEQSPGVGLYNICRLAQYNKNAFVAIATKNYMMQVSNEYPLENPAIKRLQGYFPGTIVVMRIPNLIVTNLRQVLSEHYTTSFF